MRLAFASLLAVTLCGAIATAAWADEELFELDNGTVVRGYVMRETDDELVIAMSGFVGETRVTVERGSVVKRHVLRSSKPRIRIVETAAAEAWDAMRPAGVTALDAPASDWLAGETLPVGEPARESETFVGRFVRLSTVALPNTPDAKATLAFFAIIVLVMLVSWGTRLADLPNPSLANATILAVLFGVPFMANLEFSDQLLRSDRAIWVVPLQIGGWIAMARLILGGTLGRTVLLFAFILSSLLAVLFVTGAVLVTV